MPHQKFPVALFFQTGYLAIKGYDPETGDLRLGIPNKEVERGLQKETRNIESWIVD